MRLEFNQVNSGSTFKQWNKGVRLARGKYVWIAESDDYADPRLLERLMAVLEADATVAFAYCRSWRVTEDGRKGRILRFLPVLPGCVSMDDRLLRGRARRVPRLLRTTKHGPQCERSGFSREIYERVGGADESLRLCGDWKLWAAMA